MEPEVIHRHKIVIGQYIKDLVRQEQAETDAIYRALAGYKAVDGWTCEKHVIAVTETPDGKFFCTKCDEQLRRDNDQPADATPIVAYRFNTWEMGYQFAIVRFDPYGYDGDIGSARAVIVYTSPRPFARHAVRGGFDD